MMKSSLIRSQLIFTLIFLFIPNLTSAETKTFIKEYTYQASEADSKLSCRAMALEQAKRLVLEELGTYLMSKTEVKDFAITSDKISVLTAGVVQTEIFDEKWDGVKYYLKARIKADPEDVAKAIDRLRKDEGKSKELDESRRAVNEALKEIDRLKKELETVNTDIKKQAEYQTEVNKLSAQDWYVSGVASWRAGNYQQAMHNYNQTIKLNPVFANAYNGRGAVYNDLGSYQQAIIDFTKAIDLKPDFAEAYSNRSMSYNELGDYHKGIRESTKAIELDPNLATAYNNRGFAYKSLGDFQHSIRDYSKAVELRPDEGLYWASRGYLNSKLGNTRQEIEDYKIAARLGNRAAQMNLTNMGIRW